MAKSKPKVRLYEISAMVSYHVVVAAISEKDAMEQVSTWEDAWHGNSDNCGVSDVEMFDVRDLHSDDPTLAQAEDEAHEVTSKARDLLPTD
jgi:hypothetical protein